jgi:hypothetical protein
VHFGGPFAYGECLGDLLVGLPGGEEFEDFSLAGCQRAIQGLAVLWRIGMCLLLFGE